MKTGDVVIFSSNDLPSTVVKIATQSQYVHAAIVLSARQSQTPQGAVMITESHINANSPSLGTGRSIVGVQHQWLDHRLETTKGLVWWVPLKVPLIREQRQKLQDWLRAMEAERVPYDFRQVAGAGLDLGETLGLVNKPNDDALFCSELVARALQIAGVIEDHINPAEQVPADIVQLPCFQEPILIQKS